MNDLFFVHISGKITNFAILNNKNSCILKYHLVNCANHMIINLETFQNIIVSKNGGVSILLSVQNNDLCPTNDIKVSDICNRASTQIIFKAVFKCLKIDRQ